MVVSVRIVVVFEIITMVVVVTVVSNWSPHPLPQFLVRVSLDKRGCSPTSAGCQRHFTNIFRYQPHLFSDVHRVANSTGGWTPISID